MATLNERTFVLATILGDRPISDDSDTNFMQQYKQIERMTERKQINKTPNEITTCLQTNT